MRKVCTLQAFIVAVISAGSTVMLRGGESPTAEVLLNSFQASLDRINQKAAFDAETRETYSGAYNWNVVPTQRSTNTQVRRDGGRLDTYAVEKLTYAEGIPRIPTPTSQRARRIWAEGEGKRYEASGQEPPNRLYVYNDKQNPFIAATYAMTGAGRYLDGCVVGDDTLFLVEAMRKGKIHLREEMEMIDGHRTYVLESTSQFGKKTIWLDPEYGYCARRIKVQKTVGDLWYDEPLGKAPAPLPEGAIPKEPVSAMNGFEVDVTLTGIERYDGTYLPVEAKITFTKSYANGQTTRMEALHKRSNIDLNPDFDKLGAFTMDVPNGTPVVFLDKRGATGVEYGWQDGKISVLADESFLSNLSQTIGTLDANETNLKEVTLFAAKSLGSPAGLSDNPKNLAMRVKRGSSSSPILTILVSLGLLASLICAVVCLRNRHSRTGGVR